MNIIYISPIGSPNPHLFPAFKKTFTEQGHREVYHAEEATHCFIDIQSGTISYHQNILDVVSERKIPIICFDSREFGPLNKEKWSPVLDAEIYFIRNMDKTEKYPLNVFPYDWPIFPGSDLPPATKDELFSRPYDCCFIGTPSPTRENVINGILKDGRLKLHYEYRDHTRRYSNYEQWLYEHRKAKTYLNCDGAGFTNERSNQLFSIAPMLRVINNHKPANALEDGINCLEINEHPTADDIEKVVDILAHKEWIYDIYIDGINLMKTKCSYEGVSDYVLKILNENGIT
ncbi:MAG TPA: hypothetical protein VIY47_14950 [Ignavibacteriaceae bacterium]